MQVKLSRLGSKRKLEKSPLLDKGSFVLTKRGKDRVGVTNLEVFVPMVKRETVWVSELDLVQAKEWVRKKKHLNGVNEEGVSLLALNILRWMQAGKRGEVVRFLVESGAVLAGRLDATEIGKEFCRQYLKGCGVSKEVCSLLYLLKFRLKLDAISLKLLTFREVISQYALTNKLTMEFALLVQGISGKGCARLMKLYKHLIKTSKVLDVYELNVLRSYLVCDHSVEDVLRGHAPSEVSKELFKEKLEELCAYFEIDFNDLGRLMSRQEAVTRPVRNLIINHPVVKAYMTRDCKFSLTETKLTYLPSEQVINKGLEVPFRWKEGEFFYETGMLEWGELFMLNRLCKKVSAWQSGVKSMCASVVLVNRGRTTMDELGELMREVRLGQDGSIQLNSKLPYNVLLIPVYSPNHLYAVAVVVDIKTRETVRVCTFNTWDCNVHQGEQERLFIRGYNGGEVELMNCNFRDLQVNLGDKNCALYTMESIEGLIKALRSVHGNMYYLLTTSEQRVSFVVRGYKLVFNRGDRANLMRYELAEKLPNSFTSGYSSNTLWWRVTSYDSRKLHFLKKRWKTGRKYIEYQVEEGRKSLVKSYLGNK